MNAIARPDEGSVVFLIDLDWDVDEKAAILTVVDEWIRVGEASVW